MKKGLTIILFSIIAITANAQTDNKISALDSMRMQFEGEAAQAIGDFEKYSEEAKEEYLRYEEQMRNEYLQYIKDIKQIWGNDTLLDDTQTEWVEYSDNYNSRSIVDFDKGDILIEIALEDIHRYDSVEIEHRLEKAIESMLGSRGSTCPYKSTVDISEHLTARPILEGLVDFSKYKFDDIDINIEEFAQETYRNVRPTPPTPQVRGKELQTPQTSIETKPSDSGSKETMASRVLKDKNDNKANAIAAQKEEARRKAEAKLLEKFDKKNIHAIAKTIAKQSVKKNITIKGEDNKQRTVVQVQMSLVTDNISKNAALYKDFVAKYSQMFQIEQPLIYAVMEQESRFNPEATSWVPAYGLMQLVPRSGGYDAYRYVYKREWAPTKSYLFVPHQNIELGTAYLRILMNQFSKVTDPDCRRLCVIASYNTGAGNVSRAFTGNTNISKAIPLINKYNYQQLYNHLVGNLSTSEARNYVKGVSSRREKYLK